MNFLSLGITGHHKIIELKARRKLVLPADCQSYTSEFRELAPHLFSHPLSLKLDLFQRLVSFMADLREADSLLQKAIKKVDERSKLDTVQVQHRRSSSEVMHSQFLHLQWLVVFGCRRCSSASRSRSVQ